MVDIPAPIATSASIGRAVVQNLATLVARSFGNIRWSVGQGEGRSHLDEVPGMCRNEAMNTGHVDERLPGLEAHDHGGIHTGFLSLRLRKMQDALFRIILQAMREPATKAVMMMKRFGCRL